MSEITQEQVEAGVFLYTKFFLSIYDWFALGYNCRYIWKCPSNHMLDMYNKYVTANHLDIGVGTGYFLNHCDFSHSNPRLVLMDLNPNSLSISSKRLARYKPVVHQRNVLQPFNLDVPPFDSIGIMNLLHCLPGDMDTKWAVFENAKTVLNPGGVIFGSTILYKGIKRNALATMLLKINNRKGFMTNMEDDVEVLRKNLSRHFSESNVRIIGCVAFFWAKQK